MKKLVGFILLSALLTAARAGNVKISSPQINLEELGYDNVISVKMNVSWQNSWRDAHNWDAVYVFLKYKRSTDVSWSHVLLRDAFHGISNGYTYYPARDPSNGKDKSTGLFIYRNKKGEGAANVDLQLWWKYSNNGLTRQDFMNGVKVEAEAIEMVYIPKGPFRPGDRYSNSCFQKPYRQILPEWDLITPNTTIYMGSWYNSNPDQMIPTDDDRGPDKVCDHDNAPYTSGYCGSFWKSESPGTASIIFRLNSATTVRYVAMELYAYAVSSWKISGSSAPRGTTFNWKVLGTFSKADAPVNSVQSYPATKAVKLTSPGSYEYYKIDLTMENAGHYAHVWTISMTDKDLETLTDDAYIIDGAGNTIYFNATLGLNDKENTLPTNNPTLDANYATGFEGFFAMKYEISQQQYVDFLNKLTVDEQKLRTIGDELENLPMGSYVYGSSHTAPAYRNGIVVGAIQDNRYAFACNLTPGGSNSKGYNEENDGLNIACNFLSPRDMLAYAAWSGLRPLSELEYEKMGHQTIDSLSGKVPAFPIGGYAWGNTSVQLPSGGTFSNANKSNERLSSANVNAGNKVAGPVRCGSFLNGTDGVAQSTGASFYGVMELSGNLAEIYYRSEPGRVALRQDRLSHGKGYLTNGEMPSELNTYWGTPDERYATFGQSLILRGGSFASSDKRVRFADRAETNGYTTNLNRKDSTVTFRLGHSVTALEGMTYDYYPDAWIKNENGAVFYEGEGGNVWDTVCTGTDYTIVGSDPTEETTLTGELRYVWYFSTDRTPWIQMEGKNQKDLHLTAADLDHYSTNYRNYYYKRRIYTPTQFAESGTVGLRVGTNKPFSRDNEEVLQSSNQINGVLVESAPPATFQWYSLVNGKKKSLPAFYTTSYSSYMSVIRDSFPGIATDDGQLICEVTTNELGCKKEVVVPFKIKARPSTGITSSSFRGTQCGSKAVQDPRDGEIYTTVRIGDQCWMAENMRYKGSDIPSGHIAYSTADKKGTTYGCEYYSVLSTTSLVCPSGWVVPSNTDISNLIFFANNDGEDDYGAYRLKAGNFWIDARDDWSRYHDYINAKEGLNNGGKKFPAAREKGFNTLGFGLMGGGYNGYNAQDYRYNEAWLIARYPTYSYQYIWRLNYSNRNFYYWTYTTYHAPVRCILEATSVD